MPARTPFNDPEEPNDVHATPEPKPVPDSQARTRKPAAATNNTGFKLTAGKVALLVPSASQRRTLPLSTRKT